MRANVATMADESEENAAAGTEVAKEDVGLWATKQYEVYMEADGGWVQAARLRGLVGGAGSVAIVAWKTDEAVEEQYQADLDCIRAAPEAAPDAYKPCENDVVEALDGMTWFEATIIEVKGEFVKVQYKVDEDGRYTSFIEASKIRRLSAMPTLDVAGLSQHVNKIPNAIQEYCTLDTLERLRVMSEPAFDAANINAAGTKLSLVGSPDAMDMCEAIVQMYFQEAQKRRVLEEKKRRLELQKNGFPVKAEGSAVQQGDEFVMSVKVAQTLAGVAIGVNGNNIKEASKIAGVSHIQNDNGSEKVTFVVTGTSEEAVQKACKILDVCEQDVAAPSLFVGLMIGKDGKHIEEIRSKAGVSKIILIKAPKNQPEPEERTFVVVGRRDNVKKAVTLFKLKVKHFANMEELSVEETKIDRESNVLNPRASGRYQQGRQGPAATAASNTAQATQATRGKQQPRAQPGKKAPEPQANKPAQQGKQPAAQAGKGGGGGGGASKRPTVKTATQRDKAQGGEPAGQRPKRAPRNQRKGKVGAAPAGDGAKPGPKGAAPKKATPAKAEASPKKAAPAKKPEAAKAAPAAGAPKAEAPKKPEAPKAAE